MAKTAQDTPVIDKFGLAKRVLVNKISKCIADRIPSEDIMAIADIQNRRHELQMELDRRVDAIVDQVL